VSTFEEAWAGVEAVLPKQWCFGLERTDWTEEYEVTDDHDQYRAMAGLGTYFWETYSIWAVGPTPQAALIRLADQLRSGAR
jgi:hypothetical protein